MDGTRPNERLLLGVDTGGTFTDVVIVQSQERTVLASAKALTTRHDLSIGVSNALMKVAGSLDPASVDLVSISTTLATNAVVEGHGSPVLVLLVGFDEAMVERTQIPTSFPDAIVEVIAGGHDHYGYEAVPLDTDAVRRALAAHGDSVNAIAVASTFAVRNTDHEEAVRDLVVSETELPVTVSSSLSEALDAPRRALTTALNARLLSRISDLVVAVEASLDSIGVTAPIMVVKGDGSLAAAAPVVRRPIETVLSGPAASIVGAAALTGRDDFVLSDIGGTTTDVGQMSAGRVRLTADGARVGGWRTMVEAIDVRTTGLGGDSQIETDQTEISVGPQRHVPLSLLAVDYPDIVTHLAADRNEPPPRDLAGLFALAIDVGNRPDGLSTIEQRVYDRLSDAPQRIRDVAGGALERRSLHVLVDKQLALISGFTPTDAAHVLDLQSIWNRDAAEAGALLLSWYTDEEAVEFCRRVWSETVRRSVACVLEVAAADALGGASVDGVLANPALDAAASGRPQIGGIGVQLHLDMPVVAVGGPAKVYYPEVAARCGAELVIPEEYAVANAVGAAVGEIVVRRHAEVQSDGPGLFRVVSPSGSEQVNDPAEAIERAQQRARDAALLELRERCVGLDNPGTPIEHIELERFDAPDAAGDEGLYSATIELELRSRPTG